MHPIIAWLKDGLMLGGDLDGWRFAAIFGITRMSFSACHDLGVGFPSGHKHLRLLTLGLRKPHFAWVNNIVDFTT